MRLSLDSLVLPRAAEATMAAPVVAATVAVMVVEEEATEPLHLVADDRSSSTMFVLPSTYPFL